ncbi:sulfatase-like hydrolase/transferase [Pseudomonas turukhanskensis]|uniref:sulfatase-like hydrolase/transferase n=1 Tax=Pseudomonas turukhanskensis TaxID=1806536 RepID=UPI0022F336DD|nr:sulfatase-like hydrolase/transferase [Pseudomonas turukhanskensis]
MEASLPAGLANFRLSLKSLISALVFSVFLPNVAFLCISSWLGIGRPYVNIDYIFMLVFFAFGFRFLGVIVGVVFLVVDMLSLFGQVLPIVRIGDFFYLLRFVFSASPEMPALLASGLVFVAVSLWVVAKFGRDVNRHAVLFILNVFLILYAVDVNTSTDERVRFYRASEGELVSSQAVSFFEARSASFLRNVELESDALIPYGRQSATDPWFAMKANNSLPQRMLLVVNESWGAPLDPSVRDSILAPVMGLPLEFIEQGTLPFVGVTIEGELRELCKRQPANFNLSNTVDGFSDCLPEMLRQKGYSTASLHGAVSRMYDRAYWYPRAGFEKSIFFESHKWPRRCHSFPGACDLDMADDIAGFFDPSGPRFLYWLTLNSHFAYDRRDIRVDVFDCDRFSISVGSESCRNLKLQAQFFSGLAKLLQRPSMQGVEVVVVGDHQPIIADLDERSRYFEEKKVSWVRFKIK